MATPTKIEGYTRHAVNIEGETVEAFKHFEVIGEGPISMMGSSPAASNYVYLGVHYGKGDVEYAVSNGNEWRTKVSKKDADEAVAEYKKSKPKADK